jgi:hypothetical protein
VTFGYNESTPEDEAAAEEEQEESGGNTGAGGGPIVTVEVGGVAYRLYTRSYLGLGQDEVRRVKNVLSLIFGSSKALLRIF